MSDGRTENQSSVKFLLISIILHALFVLLVPKLGYGPPAIPLSRGGTTFVTLVPSNGRDSARQAAQVTQPKRESPPPPRKSQQVVTLKSPRFLLLPSLRRPRQRSKNFRWRRFREPKCLQATRAEIRLLPQLVKSRLRVRWLLKTRRQVTSLPRSYQRKNRSNLLIPRHPHWPVI